MWFLFDRVIGTTNPWVYVSQWKKKKSLLDAQKYLQRVTKGREFKHIKADSLEQAYKTIDRSK